MAKTKNVTMTDGDIRRLILQFSWPVFVAAIFNELYNVTNSMIVGNYVSLKALSAVSACTWICNIFNHTFYGLGMGAGILMGGYIGANDHEKLKRALDSSLVFAVIGGIIITIVAELCLPLLIRLCNIGPDIYADASAYLRVYILGSCAVLVSQMSFFILRSFGDTRHQLYFSIITSIVNLILGLLFVRVFNMNVVGTALATIISQFLMDVLTLRLVLNYDGIDFDIHNLDFSFHVIVDICRLGIPAGIQNMLIAFSSMLVQSYVNLFPNEVIAGIGVAEKINSWAQMVSHAISAATMSLVAQNIGAGKMERAKESVKQCAIISSIGTLIMIVIIDLAAPFLVSRFNKDAQVIFYGTSMIRWAIFGMFFINLSHIYNAACRGAGNVRIPMMVAIFAQVICKYLFVRFGLQLHYDVHVLYLGTTFGYVMAGTLATLYFYRSKWSKQIGLR
ncbi:MAG: MATE family efflux transporter [Erysipelotrichaceae bacterium]|nr:MATE family efflux transporter [Erysipelotrichaceae bacterium]